MLLGKYNKVKYTMHKLKRLFYHIKGGDFSYLYWIIIGRLLKIHVLPFVLHFFPQYECYFTQRLPLPHERLEKTENPLDDWEILDDGGVELDSVDIIMHGQSLDLKNFHSSGNVYVVNGHVLKDPKTQKKGHLPNYGSGEYVLEEFDFPVIYAGAGFGIFPAMENNCPIFYVYGLVRALNGNMDHHSGSERFEEASEYCSRKSDSHIITIQYKGEWPHFACSTGLNVVFALAKLAKQVNIYGWDYYMEDSPKGLTHWEVLRKLHNAKVYKTTERLIELSAIHWLYAYRLKQLPHIKIQGQLNDVDHHPKIIKKIEKIFYR